MSLEKGGRYFDTAYTYLEGISEEAIRKSLVERHDRNSFILADKLPGYRVKCYDDCKKYFEESLRRCGVDFFDVYLLHWLNGHNYTIAEEQEEFRFLRELKETGMAKKIGFSYHDGSELLEQILLTHPEAAETLLTGASPARWALRFAQSLPNVEIVLSGMNTMEQMAENMEQIKPLTEQELQLCMQAAEIIRGNTAIPCTGCGYCASHCPKKIAIPEYFRLYNKYERNPGDDWKIRPVYQGLTQNFGKASECIVCRNCEKNCPQKINITTWLLKVKEKLENT